MPFLRFRFGFCLMIFLPRICCANDATALRLRRCQAWVVQCRLVVGVRGRGEDERRLPSVQDHGDQL